MSEKLLIVFEGIDNSGKTSLSKGVCENLDNFTWAKEPTFTTEEADRLNDQNNKINEYERELLFLESRIRRQPAYQNNNIILDRYLWTGMTYAEVFSPKVYEFSTYLYQNYNIFRKPDFTIFVDTPVEVCQKREPILTIERLDKIRKAYLNNQKYVNTDILTISGEGNLKYNIDIISNTIKDIIKTKLSKS